MPRRNDFDGRGNLSEEELAKFVHFFLKQCVDQVDFMESLMQPKRLRDRIRIWAEEEVRAGELPPKAIQILDAILYRGEIERGELPELLGGVTPRHARRVSSSLLSKGVFTAAGPRSPLRLAFPAVLAGRWMPKLFPDQ